MGVFDFGIKIGLWIEEEDVVLMVVMGFYW